MCEERRRSEPPGSFPTKRDIPAQVTQDHQLQGSGRIGIDSPIADSIPPDAELTQEPIAAEHDRFVRVPF
jgi:hypothetical protein